MGMSAGKIAEALGVSRNAVCGKVHRLNLPPRTTLVRSFVGYEILKERRKASGWVHPKKKPEKPKTKSNLPANLPATKRPAPAVVVALPVAGVDDATLVAGWLAQHGGPRKFARGETADPFGLRFWLEARGYSVKYTQKDGGKITVARVGAKGRPMSFTGKKFIAFVDHLRVYEGLEPLSSERKAA